MYSDTPELPMTFVAVNLLNVPSCKPNSSNAADLIHRVSSLEQQMNKVLSMKLSYANVANPPAPMQNTPKRVVPGQSIPVTDPHYLQPGSLLRKKQPLSPYLDRSKSVEEAIDRTVDDLNDNPAGHVSTVPQDSVDDDNTPFTVHRKRRNNYNAVFGRKKNDKCKRGLQKHNIFIFNISSDVTKEEIEAHMTESGTDNGVVVKQMIRMTKDNPSDCYHVTVHCYDIEKIFDCDFWWWGGGCRM